MSTDHPALWRLAITVPADQVPGFEAALDGVCGALTALETHEGGPWRIEGYTDVAPDEDAIRAGLALAAAAMQTDPPTLEVEFLTPRDWLAENLATFAPLHIGRFFIYPSHFDGHPPGGAIPFCIDAGMAFGSGTHPTTATCLRAMIDLSRRAPAARILDMGCGSAILSLAAARLWPAAVLGVDIDPASVTVATRNIADNRLKDRVRAVCGNGYRTHAVRRAAPFNVIVANVLARPLIGMAGDTAAAVRPGGTVILSGLLAKDAAWVAGHHRARGLRLVDRYRHDDWVTLVMERPAP